jgi:hypothetical protein
MTNVNDTSTVKPTNSIVCDRSNIQVTTKKVETATNVYPGRLVKKGSDDNDIVVNTAAGAPLGWAGYEDTHKKYRPATVDTIYVVNSYIAVVKGAGMKIVASLASGQNVVAGAILVAAANGELTAATAAAIPSGTTAVTSSSAQPTVAGSLSSEGIPVAVAEQSMDASAGALDIIVRSLI